MDSKQGTVPESPVSHYIFISLKTVVVSVGGKKTSTFFCEYILSLPVTGKVLKQKHTQAITKTVAETVSCAFTPGALPLIPALNFSHPVSVPLNHRIRSVH